MSEFYVYYTRFVSYIQLLDEHKKPNFFQFDLLYNQVLLDNGYFAIGRFSDYGEICFDLNEETNEPRIVMLDYETAGLEYLSDSFVDLLKATLEISEPIIKELKPWQKKMYKME